MPPGSNPGSPTHGAWRWLEVVGGPAVLQRRQLEIHRRDAACPTVLRPGGLLVWQVALRRLAVAHPVLCVRGCCVRVYSNIPYPATLRRDTTLRRDQRSLSLSTPAVNRRCPPTDSPENKFLVLSSNSVHSYYVLSQKSVLSSYPERHSVCYM